MVLQIVCLALAAALAASASAFTPRGVRPHARHDSDRRRFGIPDRPVVSPTTETATRTIPTAAATTVTTTTLFFEYGIYDEQLWDDEAKKDVYQRWDPNAPRSTRNFNPFETFEGNSPDASGIYPGESRYKDPIRPEMNFQQMMKEREEAEERANNPKEGDVPGCPGCKN